MAEYDTSPSIIGRAIFAGAWGVYPFSPSGNIYVSDSVNGLFIFSFSDPPTSVNPNQTELPDQFVLFENYPNPFNPETTIEYRLPKASKVKLEIYTLLGQQVVTLEDEQKPAGLHSVKWLGKDGPGTNMPSGIYFYRLQANDFVKVMKLTLLR